MFDCDTPFTDSIFHYFTDNNFQLLFHILYSLCLVFYSMIGDMIILDRRMQDLNKKLKPWGVDAYIS